MLERHHLAIIREVHRTGTLTRAARQLHLTQPALTHAVKKLEQQLDTPIWQKQGRRLRLTPAGHYLLKLGNRLLPQFEQAESQVRDMARGRRGRLKIGMECHPCYQWLLKLVGPYLQQWPDVDVDVRQAFTFGGVGALFAHEIDLLITPDPFERKGLTFVPVFDYEQVLVVGTDSPLAKRRRITPGDLESEILITYPVERERLDIFSQFLLPARCMPREHKTIETTDIMLQMVAANRGVAALPRWLVEEYRRTLPIKPVKLGSPGIHKKIHLGIRSEDKTTDYIAGFLELAEQPER